jgi:hypothetical protein
MMPFFSFDFRRFLYEIRIGIISRPLSEEGFFRFRHLYMMNIIQFSMDIKLKNSREILTMKFTVKLNGFPKEYTFETQEIYNNHLLNASVLADIAECVEDGDSPPKNGLFHVDTHDSTLYYIGAPLEVCGQNIMTFIWDVYQGHRSINAFLPSNTTQLRNLAQTFNKFGFEGLACQCYEKHIEVYKRYLGGLQFVLLMMFLGGISRFIYDNYY